MSEATPAGVWDARTDYHDQRTHERFAWAQEHFPDAAKQVYRAEFWRAETPFAIVYQYATDDHGSRYFDRDIDDVVTMAPVRVELAELPPAGLLNGAP